MFEVKTTQEKAIISTEQHVKKLADGTLLPQVYIEADVRDIYCIFAGDKKTVYHGTVTLGGRDAGVQTTIADEQDPADCLWLLTGLVVETTIEASDEALTAAAKVHASLVEQSESLTAELTTIRAQVDSMVRDYMKRMMQPYAELFLLDEMLTGGIEAHKEAVKSAAIEQYLAHSKKTFAAGVFGLSVRPKMWKFDMDAALAYCRENWKDGILPERVDEKAFEKAAKEGFIKPGVDVCDFVDVYSLSVYKSKFEKLAE
jgi:hypothetical protein